MKLKCLGAGQEVGRSSFLLKTDSERILFDYGLKLQPQFQDIETKEQKTNIKSVHKPLELEENIDSIILSHAHLDHSGYIPKIYKKSNPNLFLTDATLDLSNLLWEDTIKIAKFDDQDPPFYKEDIHKAYDNAFFIDLDTTVEISEKSKLTFYDAGHIPGSVISVLETQGKKIMYTGDYRSDESLLFKGCSKKLPKVDYLITETTYGDENHKDREKLEQNIIEIITNTLENQGKVLMAAFAIERSQEIIALLEKYNIKAPIYLDGMSVKASKIFLHYPEYFKDFKKFKKALSKVEFITSHRKRKKIKDEPCIIITTAGMLEGGPIFHYLKEFGDDENNSLIMTGYQVEGTNGDRLLKTGKLYIDKEPYQPRLKIAKYSLSGHPDKDQLIDLIKKTNPKKVVCIHGDPKKIESFQKTLKQMNINSIAPKNGDEIDL